VVDHKDGDGQAMGEPAQRAKEDSHEGVVALAIAAEKGAQGVDNDHVKGSVPADEVDEVGNRFRTDRAQVEGYG
jgi:hypothetical protein